MVGVHTRVTADVLKRLDKLRPLLSKMQGRNCSRSDALREAIVTGLRALETEDVTLD